MLEDGLEEIFVNAEVCDGTDIAELTAHNDRIRANNQPAACSETQGRPTFFLCVPGFFRSCVLQKCCTNGVGENGKPGNP